MKSWPNKKHFQRSINRYRLEPKYASKVRKERKSLTIIPTQRKTQFRVFHINGECNNVEAQGLINLNWPKGMHLTRIVVSCNHITPTFDRSANECSWQKFKWKEVEISTTRTWGRVDSMNLKSSRSIVPRFRFQHKKWMPHYCQWIIWPSRMLRWDAWGEVRWKSWLESLTRFSVTAVGLSPSPHAKLPHRWTLHSMSWRVRFNSIGNDRKFLDQSRMS